MTQGKARPLLEFLKKVLQFVLLITGFVGTIVTSLSQMLGWMQETQTLHIFAVVLFGLFFVSVAWFVYNAQVNQKWSWLWGSIVVLYIVSIGFFFWIGTWIKPRTPKCSDYSIHITSPLTGTSVREGVIDVKGTYQGNLSADRIVIIVSSPDGSENWPSSVPVEIEPTLGRWKGTAALGGEPPQSYRIAVALVGRSGRALLRYYYKVGLQTGQWHSIEVLPDDVEICDQVSVEKK